jgi:hypothetical protein
MNKPYTKIKQSAIGPICSSNVSETEVIYLDTKAFTLKFSYSKREVNNEGRRINGPAL